MRPSSTTLHVLPLVALLALGVGPGCAKAPPPVAGGEPVAVDPTGTTEAPAASTPAPEDPSVQLPASLEGRVEILVAADPDATVAALDKAIKAEGDGGIYEGWAVRLTEDMTVYRMWNGPEVLDSAGRTNRLGGWWTSDAPAGPVDEYRVDYEICDSWNDLTWVASCTLHAGAVVAVGPGQSVSLATCGDDTPPHEEGSELAFPQSPEHWQLYIDQPWTKEGPDEELDCTEQTEDYRADPADLSQALVD